MFDHHHYVPILKAKQAEYQSLSDLDGHVKLGMTPMLELPPLQRDFDEEDKFTETIDQHLAKTANRLAAAWGSERPFFLDGLYLIDADNLTDGRHPLVYVTEECQEKGLCPVPVTGLFREPDYQAATRQAATVVGSGACVRVDLTAIFQMRSQLNARLRQLVSDLGLEPGSVDLVIDLQGFQPDQEGLLGFAAVTAIDSISSLEEYRTLTVAGTAFPSTLASCAAGATTLLPRSEWTAWLALTSANLARVPTFGDYAVASYAFPEQEVNPRVMTIAPNIRYTTSDAWLIVRGRSVKLSGYSQYFELSRELVKRPEYMGPVFSWGDQYIDRCAKKEVGPGNQTIWRRVGTTHHLTFVVDQIASLALP